MDKLNINLTQDKVLEFLNYKNQDIEKFKSVIQESINVIKSISQSKYISDKQEIISKTDESLFLKNGIVLKGKAITKHLEGCNFAIITVSTIGYEVDKKIMSLQKISPFKALIMDAAASAMAELITDTLHKEVIIKYGQTAITNRFSPGYKDLPLKTNKDIIDTYNLTKKFGIMINDDYLMSPAKTITAITGIRGE